ncbi:hypothetical protein HW114_04490 [Serratia symbiotica]|nr:hypothetical protein [Serratia symbiotica]MBF1994826.1 hypothetical protein [Serratia symbiotica]
MAGIIGDAQFQEAKKNLRIDVGWCNEFGFNMQGAETHQKITFGMHNLSRHGENLPAGNRNVKPQSVTSGIAHCQA